MHYAKFGTARICLRQRRHRLLRRTLQTLRLTLGAPDAALPWLDALATSIADAGIQAHAKKAVTAVLDETVIGIDVVDGCFFAPHAPKLAKVLYGCLHFLRERKASQLEVAQEIAELEAAHQGDAIDPPPLPLCRRSRGLS